MVIDIVFLLLLLLSIIKGYSRGLIIAVVSFLAIFIGLAAAMKLSVIVAGWLGANTNIAKEWLPFIAFGLVMIGVIILVRWLAGLLEKSIECAMLGWFNKLAGIALYIFLYITFFSIILFYATQMALLKNETIASSKIYPYIEPLAPKVMNVLSSALPFFKNMFEDLKNFFSSVSQIAV